LVNPKKYVVEGSQEFDLCKWDEQGVSGMTGPDNKHQYSSEVIQTLNKN